MSCDAATNIYLVLGSPVAHSLSPALHNAAFKELGLNCVYLAADVSLHESEKALSALRSLKIKGANITTPLKESVIEHLDEVSKASSLLKSVNTIINKNGCLYGTTTDGAGFYHYMKEELKDFEAQRPVMLIGAGAAARSVAYTLAAQGVSKFYVFNRTLSRAKDLCQLLQKNTPVKTCQAFGLGEEEIKEALKDCPVLIYSLPFDLDQVLAVFNKMPLEGKTLFDFRYAPRQTKVMKEFIKGGGQARNGLGMLIYQAKEAFEIFTGQQAPLKAMKGAVNFPSKERGSKF